MNARNFIRALPATTVGPRRHFRYSTPTTYLHELTSRVGVRPHIGLGPNGFVLEFLLDDGKAIILAQYKADNLIENAIVFVVPKPELCLKDFSSLVERRGR